MSANMKTVDLDEIIVERVTPDTPGMMTHNEAITCMKEAIRQDRQIRDEKVREVLKYAFSLLSNTVSSTGKELDCAQKIQTLLTEL